MATQGITFPVAPMKATLGQLPSGGDWAFEIKWDGYRTIVHVDDCTVRLQSSAGHDVSARWPELQPLGHAVNASSAVLDAELVVLDDDGRPRFELVQRSGVGGERQAALYLFDVLRIDDTATVDLAYEDRRALLDRLVEPGDNWTVPAHRVGDGAALLAATADQGLEGVIAKRIGSRYEIGRRSKAWRKVKNRRRVTLAVGGWTAGTGRRAPTFGSLLLGRRDPAADPARSGGLRFAGAVGTGFDQTALDELHHRLGALVTEECPFSPPPPRSYTRTATWVAPVFDAVVEIAEFTNDGLVRHASFVEVVEPR